VANAVSATSQPTQTSRGQTSRGMQADAVAADLAGTAVARHRPGVLVMINMIVAILLVHAGMLIGLNGEGGYALELQAFYLFGGLAVALLGAGRIAVGRPGPLN